MRLRLTAGCLLGIAAVAVSGPPSWLPWGAWVRGLLPQAWWLLPVIASGLLLAAAACLPGRPAAGQATSRLYPTVHRAEVVALGLGLLLLLEPLLHLLVLAFLAGGPAPGGAELLLPGGQPGQAPTLFARILILCALVPVAEELFFRGRLLPLLAGRIGVWGALSCSSLLFAAAHGAPITCLVALPIGLLLGWLRLRHRDLGACVLIHQAHNALFVLAGPALITAPLTMAVLAIGGCAMLTLAAMHSRLGWRAIPIGLAVAALLAALTPGLLTLKDRLWAEGVARLAERASAEPAPIVLRLDAQARRGRLTAARSALLRAHLDDRGADAARAVRLWLDAEAAEAASEDEAWADLHAAARVGAPPPRLAAAATAIGLRWPEALAGVAQEEPAIVAAWLGPAGADRALRAVRGRERKLLLAALEHAWPGRLASVLLALPAEAVTPLDRRHLRQHYREAEALINALDPARQAAWTAP